VELAPSADSARYDLAEAYTDTGEFAKAQQNLDLLPLRDAKVAYQAATILMYQGKDARAVPLLRAAVQQAPAECEFWMQLAIAERRLGRTNESRNAARQGLNLAERQLTENPRNGSTRAMLGYFCAQLNQRDRAESETAQALQLAPRELNVIWLAVLSYETLAMRDNAIAALRSAPPEMLEDLKRWPDMADFTADSRFIELTAAANAAKKEKRP
jgi:Flp pilus assembly protein TadD